MDEQIAESVLYETFNCLKQDKARAYINIDDFRSAVLRYKPDLIAKQIEVSHQKDTDMTVLNGIAEDLFRNICETVSPVIEPSSTATGSS